MRPFDPSITAVSSQRRLSRRERAELLARKPRRILLDEFEALLAEFEMHVVAARRLKVTDPKHDALIRMGLQGFALTSRVFKWAAPHFLYLQRKARQQYGPMGDGPLLFFCLAAGYALGLAEEDQLSKQEFKAAEQHLDGIIRLNLPQIRDGFARAMAVK